MKRIILHWTAGSHKASKTDKRHYHFIIEHDGNVVEGNYPPEANESTATNYAAHTRMKNAGSIGVAVAAMHGAKERPFSPGKYPITTKQIDALARLCARLSAIYGIPVERDRILTHAEVEPTLGVKQRGKWDITWLPGMTHVGHPHNVGDLLRQKVRDELEARAPKPTPEQKPERPNPIAALIRAFLSLLRKG